MKIVIGRLIIAGLAVSLLATLFGCPKPDAGGDAQTPADASASAPPMQIENAPPPDSFQAPGEAASKPAPAGKEEEMRITSIAFENGKEIPVHFTADGEDVNPPLAFSGVPPEAKSLVLIMDDPDAPMGTWDHWILFNIPPDIGEIKEKGVPLAATPGKNSWGRTWYGGPAPPKGTHRYYFKLYALDTTLNLEKGASRREVEAAMKGHILAEAQLMGKYSKKS